MPIHFLMLYEDNLVLFSDDYTINGPLVQSDYTKFRALVEYFVEKTFKVYELHQILPSVIAGAIILLSRQLIGIEKVYNEKLSDIHIPNDLVYEIPIIQLNEIFSNDTQVKSTLQRSPQSIMYSK